MDLFLQRVMSRDQIIGLGTFGSVPRCNNRLAKLVGRGLIRRYKLASRGSGSQALYCLDQSASHIVAARLDVEIREVQLQTRRDCPALFLEHTLGLVDLRIQFVHSAKQCDLAGFEWTPELLCRHEFSVRERGSWKPHVLKPDGLVRWMHGGEDRYLFVELDLGHVSQTAFSRKADSYRTYLTLGVFTEVYGATTFEVAVVTTSERRLAHLQTIAGRGGSPSFLFTTLERIKREGPLGCIWQNGHERVALSGGDL